MTGAIPNRPAGTSARARFYQWIWDSIVLQSRPGSVRGAKVSSTTGGVFIEPIETGTGTLGSRVQQYILTDASNGDYFICRTLSVSKIGATDIYIARPYELRQSAFDRDVLNAEHPENIGTADEITRDVVVESWDGATFNSEIMAMSFEYKSANYRIATDATDEDPDNWTTEKQTIIPRLVPADLDEPEDGDITTTTISPTIITASRCSGLGITATVGDDTRDVTLLAFNDGLAWMKSAI